MTVAQLINAIEIRVEDDKMAKPFKHLSQLLCAGLLIAAASSVGAQSAATYPNRPVRVIVPFTAGGAVSTIVNLLGDRFAKETGQPMIADYRPGGDTVVGFGIAAKATPDGYTLLEGTSSYMSNHWMIPDLPFDSLKDLTPVAMLGTSSYVLTINPSIANSLSEFISRAKTRPGELNFAYTGSVAILSGQLFMKAAGIKMQLISYKGTALLTAAVVGGEAVGSITGLTTVQPLITAGRLRALAVTGDKRMGPLPDVPTFAEAGLKDFTPTNWFVLLAPAKTPRDIIVKMNTIVRKAQQSPDMIRTLSNANIDIYSTSVAEAQKFIQSEAAVYGKVIKESGIKAD